MGVRVIDAAAKSRELFSQGHAQLEHAVKLLGPYLDHREVSEAVLACANDDPERFLTHTELKVAVGAG